MISHLANTSNDLERPIESFGQLVRDFLWTFGRRLPMRSTFKQDPFSGLIAHFAPLAISVHFHGCLPLQKFLVNGLKDFLSVSQHVVHDIEIRGPRDILWKIEGFAAKGDLIWSGSYGCIPGSVMGPLCPWEKLTPCSWPAVDKCMQVLFNNSIENLSLAITLWVIGWTHSQ